MSPPKSSGSILLPSRLGRAPARTLDLRLSAFDLSPSTLSICRRVRRFTETLHIGSRCNKFCYA